MDEEREKLIEGEEDMQRETDTERQGQLNLILNLKFKGLLIWVRVDHSDVRLE